LLRTWVASWSSRLAFSTWFTTPEMSVALPVARSCEACAAVCWPASSLSSAPARAWPNASPDPAAHRLGLPDSLIDFTADTTRAIAQLHYSNTFARTPDVTYIFSHAGGTVPYLAGRFAIVDQMDVIPGAENRASAADTFGRLYWDTALSWSDPVLTMLRSVVGIDHVLFGTDYPYLRRDLAVGCRQHIVDSAVLTDSERASILGGTAARLIPRLARVLSP